jgi:hypothetical protein
MAAVSAKPPPTNSTEALLLEWSWKPYYQTVSGVDDQDTGPDGKILIRGAEAVPNLIALINDRRLTMWDGSWHRVLLGELAQNLLQQITGLQGPFDEDGTGAKEFKDWLKRSREVGEEKIMEESVFGREDGQITDIRTGPAAIIAQKYPGKLSALCEEFVKAANPDTESSALGKAIVAAKLSKQAKVDVLAGLARHGSLKNQSDALQCLASLDGKTCAEILLPILQNLPADTTNSYGNCPEAGFALSVLQLDDDQIWRELLRYARRSAVGLRMEMLESMDSLDVDTNRTRRLAFLAAFLDDATVREMPADTEEDSKFDGTSAASEIKKITVRDFAALKLAPGLELPDEPDNSWTPAQWLDLRQRVRQKLESEKLPKM